MPGGLPAGVSLRAIDGGPNYYAAWTNAMPTNASFFPIGVWGSYDHTLANIAIDKARGLNTYVWYADTAQYQIDNIRNSGMWGVVDQAGDGGRAGRETVARLTDDELDMRCATCFSQLESTIGSLPRDGRMVYANYGKGVLLWQSDSSAQRWINGTAAFGEYQNIVSSDLYWFTDPNQLTMVAPSWVPEAGQTIGRDKVERGANYGYQIDRMRYLDGLDGVRQPVWAFVEVGCPWSECGGDFDAIKPAEIRSAVWHSIIAGARGIIYFQHTFAGPSGCVTHHALREPGTCYAAVQSAVTALDSQVAQLAPVLNAEFADGYVTASGGVRAMAKKGPDGAWYVFAGSTGGATTATFTVAAGRSVEVLFEGRTVALSSGRFTDSFADGNAVHIYKIT